MEKRTQTGKIYAIKEKLSLTLVKYSNSKKNIILNKKKIILKNPCKIVYTNAGIYKGEFKIYKDPISKKKIYLRHGYGKFIWPNGDSYTGRFKNDKINGGNFTNAKKNKEIADFLRDHNIKGGSLKCIVTDNSVLVGNIINNKKEGNFQLQLNDKCFYELKDGKMKKISVSEPIKGTAYFKNNKIIYETLYNPTNKSKLCREYIYEKDKVIHKITLFSNDGRQYGKFSLFTWIGQKKIMEYKEKNSNGSKKRKLSKL
tara:strand:+ start:1084 stop:1854 length:771 start_codon:yes stop_codon:yes gene_type:complete